MVGTIIAVIIALVVGGVAWAILNIALSFVTIDPRLVRIIQLLIGLVVFLWILSIFGVWDYVPLFHDHVVIRH